MTSEGIFCTGCGITLRSFMTACPRCGKVREEAAFLVLPSASSEPPGLDPAPDASDPESAPNSQTELTHQHLIRQQQIAQKHPRSGAPLEIVFLSPTDDYRRFPTFDSNKWKLMGITMGVLGILLVTAYLFWRQDEQGNIQSSSTSVMVAPPPPATAPEPSPTPIDDRSINEAVKATLLAYNPIGFKQYKVETKDGVVTIEGVAEHQPEKDGAGNVAKLVLGVKSIVNNLKVKPEDPLAHIQVNMAEARLLDEALMRQVEENSRGDRQQQAELDQRREAERQQRELAAARQHEEEIALRKAAEEKLRREAEEFEKREEELRRAEAERRVRAEQARLEASVLRSGTVAWSGIVDGVDEVIFSGGSASVRHISGSPPREVRTSFSAPIPRSVVKVDLISSNGRNPVQIQQQPATANGYTTIVLIDDSNKAGDKRYEFILRWTLQ